MSLRDQAAIVGVGETEYSRESGRIEPLLTLEAITPALDDAGLSPQDVDGLMRWTVDTSGEGEVAANIGIPQLAFFGEISQAGNVGAEMTLPKFRRG